MNRLENWRRESCFTTTMLVHKSLWVQWLLCVKMALHWLIILHILLIWHHLLYVPQLEKHLAGKQYRTDDEVISAVKDFFEDQDESFDTTGIQAMQHQWKKCVDCKGDYVVKLDHCIIVSLWTFQPTLEYALLYYSHGLSLILLVMVHVNVSDVMTVPVCYHLLIVSLNLNKVEPRYKEKHEELEPANLPCKKVLLCPLTL